MSASIFERIAEQVKLALIDNIEGVDDRVERGREDAIGTDEGDSIIVFTADNANRPVSDDVDDNELSIGVSIYVRGDVWETRADEYAVLAHPLVRNHSYFDAGIKVAAVRLADQDWTAEAGDNTPGKRVLRYSFRFLTLAADITAQP